jgi:hypothetical protein
MPQPQRINMSVSQVDQALLSLFDTGMRQRVIDELLLWQSVNDSIVCEKVCGSNGERCKLRASHVGACSPLPVEVLR